MALESIALIPSGYKATKVYSQLPVNGNGDFTFDRGTATSVQTRVNKNGLIESVAQDVPRLDYLDGGCPSLLLEPASTNLITYSEDIDNVAWSKFFGTITANAILSPDGSVNADKFEEDGSTDSHFFRQTVSVTSGNDYAGSIFLKAAEYSSIRVKSDLLSSWDCDTTFDLSNGTFVVSRGDANMVDYGNGWYRCSISAPVTVTGTRGIEVYTSIGTGTLGNGFYAWGGQIEQQSYATSYIPNLTTGTATRAAETCNGAGTTAEINSQEGVLYAEIRALADDLTNRHITLSDGTDTNRLVLKYDNQSNVIQAFNRVSGIETAFLTASVTDITLFSKCALKFKLNDYALWINGVKVDTDTISTTFPSSTLNDLKFSATNAEFYGKVKDLRVYKEALSDLELARLTGFTSFAEMRSYLGYTSE